jgi:hypothetical protein
MRAVLDCFAALAMTVSGIIQMSETGHLPVF